MKPGDKGWDFVLERYTHAQNYIAPAEIRARYTYQGPTQYDRALQELLAGKKESHWMWFVFPQIKGLGSSTWDETYSIKSLNEAECYLADSVLGERLRICTQAVLNINTNNPEDVFDYPDNLKLRSCMTLFEIASYGQDEIFGEVIDKYYDGERDPLTIQILETRSRELIR